MFFSTKTSALALFISLASFAPGVNPTAVQNKAPNDSSYVDYNDFQDSMISTHNKWRREHGVSDVSWDPELAAYAETISRGCSMQHSVGDIMDSYIPRIRGLIPKYSMVHTVKTSPPVTVLRKSP